MLTDGTSMEGYVCKKDGYFGPKGRVMKAGRAGPMDFWTYALAYRITGDAFMWEMVRSIGRGNGYVELGSDSAKEPQLPSTTSSAEAPVILGFLELFKKTGVRGYLEAAQRIGKNILEQRFHKGFFVPSKKHVFAKFDALEPLVLLSLAANSVGKADRVPTIWPTRSYFQCPFDGLGRTFDNDAIYARVLEAPKGESE